MNKPVYTEMLNAGVDIADIQSRSLKILESLRSRAINQETGQKQSPSFAIGKVAELVGRTPAAIREAEKDGRLPVPEREASGRRARYDLSAINHMRDVFGTRPWRASDDPPCVLAVQNFKGGVGKSTLATHLAQYLAIQGYRVCLIDCDSQASSSMMFGYVPDLDLNEEDTLYPYLRYDELESLEYALRPTHFDGLYLLPANLRLFQAEYELAARMATGEAVLLNRLAQGIASIADHFDVIIMDPPPALGAISLSVIRAANALLVPLPPTLIDFSSTTAFFAMLDETLNELAARGMQPDLNFLRIVATRSDENKSMQREILAMMKSLYGHHLLRAAMKDSAEIDNATARLLTVYELDAPITSRDVHNRCISYLNSVNAEIELDIRQTWPSHHERLRKEGLI